MTDRPTYDTQTDPQPQASALEEPTRERLTATATPARPSAIEEGLSRLPLEEQGPAAAFLAAHPAGAGAPVAIVIPAYNEEPTVADVVRQIPDKLAGLATEVIVVVDGATDATADKAAEAGALVCNIPVNRGQGLVFKLGYWLARARGAEIIATIDADGQYIEAELERL